MILFEIKEFLSFFSNVDVVPQLYLRATTAPVLHHTPGGQKWQLIIPFQC